MYIDFRVINIEPDLMNKQIIVTTNNDIDPSTVDNSTVQIYDHTIGNYIKTNLEVKNEKIFIIFEDYPKPNKKYRIFINDISNIVEDKLKNKIATEIEFRSSITSTINIITPSDFQEIESTFIQWEEKTKTDFVNNYYLEISTENSFHNIKKSTIVKNNQQILLDDLYNGQYYLRIRAQSENDFGEWSKTVSFIFKKKEEVKEEDIIFEKPLNIIQSPINGESPQSFIFEFESDIDETDIEEKIMIFRRNI